MKLSRKRQQWVAERSAPEIKGDPLHPPVAIEQRYRVALQSLVATMAEDYRRQLRRAWKSATPTTDHVAAMDASLASQVRMTLSGLGRKWERVFSERSRKLTDRMVSSVNNSSMSAVKSSLKTLSGGVTIPVPKLPGELQDSIKASVAWNVSLIRDIQTQFAQRVESATFAAIQGQNEGAATVFEELTKIDGMSQRRAKNIADDQVRKVTSAMNSARVQAAGVEEFTWRHSGGGAHPRELHQSYDGQVFRYDDPPIIDEATGERGLPGQAINCRCFMQPVLKFE